MTTPRQDIEAGDSSVNIQARDISFGLSYADAKDVAMDVFESNFTKLSQRAGEVAMARAEEFLDKFLRDMAKTGATEISEAENPDFQLAIFTAQREYARSGDADLGNLLAQLLVDRSEVTQRDLKQIVLGESLGIAPKLTVEQLDVLALVFFLRYSKRPVGTLEELRTRVFEPILPFLGTITKRQSSYQHLEYTGCGAISIGQLMVEDVWRKTYPGLLSNGFSEANLTDVGFTVERLEPLLMPSFHHPELFQIRCINDKTIEELAEKAGFAKDETERVKTLQNSKVMTGPEILAYALAQVPELSKLFEVWRESPMKSLSLTSVGIAIGHANFQRRTGEKLDLSIWI